jgi:hypothetical protein
MVGECDGEAEGGLQTSENNLACRPWNSTTQGMDSGVGLERAEASDRGWSVVEGIRESMATASVPTQTSPGGTL